MSFPSADLSVVALAVDGDPRPDPEQPFLLDGIHLRWSFASRRGFPWYGFYLFRRPADDNGPNSAAMYLARRWEPIGGLPGPICLPVSSGTYPCPGRPADEGDAVDLARSRIHYGSVGEAMAAFFELRSDLDALVAGGPGGPPMASIPWPGGPLEQNGATMTFPPLLDFLQLAALQPAMAQILGLYWVDTTAERNHAYDYLLLAMHEEPASQALGGTSDLASQWVRQHAELFERFTVAEPWPGIDRLILFNKRLTAEAELEAPAGLRAYNLPSSPASAGLVWDRPPLSEPNLPTEKAAVFYHVRHAWLGEARAPDPAPSVWSAAFELVTRDGPILLAGPPATPPPHPADWPPSALCAVDASNEEGWYAYCVTSIDLFGRFSTRSDPAAWYQWAPAPDPRPWYYIEPPGDRVVQGWAVALLDKTPPPAPGLEAWTVDRDDPLLVYNPDVTAWLADHPGTVGLRLRWTWTAAQQAIAPDLREFRLYWQPGRLNAHLGTIRRVGAAAADESEVETDLVDGQAPDAWRGAWLQVGNDGFSILGSAGGATLRLRVRNLGPGKDVRPPVGRPCTVSLPPGHPLATDYSHGSSWSHRFRIEPATGSAGTYDIILPWPDGLAPRLEEPVVYAHVGLSAADDKDHTDDDPRWNGTANGDRPGNESRIGPPATVFRVLRQKPPRPRLPDVPERYTATPPDYHGRSSFTFRWKNPGGYHVHVLRALDDAVIQADRLRPARRPLADEDPERLPAGWEEAAHEIDAIPVHAPEVSYDGLSDRAMRVLACLNEVAFTQITLRPLPEAETLDLLGPDDPPGFVPPADLRAYIDSNLPGCGKNRYFYCAAFLDGAHNRGGLSLASQPVYLAPQPPPAPAVTAVLGGDRTITLRWARGTAEVEKHRIYRAGSREDAADLRTMQRFDHPSAVPEWTDTAVPGRKMFHYRVVAVAGGQEEIASAPSEIAAGRAFDDSRPEAPVWVDAGAWVRVTSDGTLHPWSEPEPAEPWTPAVELRWQSPEPLEALVQRRSPETGNLWLSISPFLPATQTVLLDRTADPGGGCVYRLRGRSLSGNLSDPSEPLAVEPAGAP